MSKKSPAKKLRPEMIVAGVMSGTSADGINVALLRFASPRSSSSSRSSSLLRTPPIHTLPFQLLGHAEYAYPKKVRAAILAAMNAGQASVADLARLNFLLGELYAAAVLAAQRRFKVRASLVGCHGQTLYHQGQPQNYLGRKLTTTWQTGEAAIIAARVGVPVVADFRPADLAAGGKGAPLVPYLDYLLFRDPLELRVVQNIGGIANLTAIRKGAEPGEVIAFDTGPGNMVIDAVVEKFFGRPYDGAGKIAATGSVLQPVLDKILQREFFRKKPPRTAGREEFGREFVRDFLQLCGRAPKRDIVATATALTACSIAEAVRRFVLKRPPVRTGTSATNPKTANAAATLIASGGGTKNRTLIAMLARELAPLGVQLKFSDDFDLPSSAKEAAAFAVLAHETWHRRASNIPSATGAKRPAVLGKISYP